METNGLKGSQSIPLVNDEDKKLINKIEALSKKENRSLSDMLLSLLKVGYAEYESFEIDYPEQLSVVSLFAGAGGLDTGLEMAGFNIVWANEYDGDACETYSANHKRTYVERGDVRKVDSFPKAEMVVGGYPCQGFSLAGNRLITDDRNYLYKEFIRCLRQSDPKFFIAENVKGLMTLNGGKILEAMIQEYRDEGYIVDAYLVNAKDYGVPQDRERVFIIGVRSDIDFTYKLPKSTHGGWNLEPYVTLEDAIVHLKSSEIGEYDQSGFSSRYLSRNRKRGWGEVSFTIQASGRHAPMHPSGEAMVKLGQDEWILPETTEHRKLSYVECALIQTFPPNYIWKGNLSSIYKQVGNAVPCLLAKVIAKPVADFLKGELKQSGSNIKSIQRELELWAN